MRGDSRRRDALVVVTCPGGLARVAKQQRSGRRWLYLGKDVEGKKRVESLLGSDARWECGAKLRDAAANLRQPFLDFVAEVGDQQRDRVSWWSTRFSWKMWITSDLFLLICYLHVAQEIIHEAIHRRIGLLLVVEDRWLLHQLKENRLRFDSNVHFTRVGRLGWQNGRAIFLGIVRRAWWLWTVSRNYISQRRVWSGGRPQPPSKPAVAIFSYPLPSCFQTMGGWEDPHMPRLDRLLQELGYRVVRFSPPDRPGFERELAERRAYVQPLILWVTVGGIWRSLRAFWWQKWPRQPLVAGLPVRRLVEREWWMEVGRASLCGFRLFHECLRGMLREGQWRWIVMPYENQPWEKMIALCARERGVRVVGIQTAILSRYYLPYFLGRGEADRMPLPDVICTSGPHAQRLLIEGGNPPERLRMCGSIRYPHLTAHANGNSLRKLEPTSRSDVLVALPIDPHMVEHLLAAIRAAFPRGGVDEGLRFRIRSHPLFPVKREDLGFPADVIPSSFQDLAETLRVVDLVIFCGSTVGFEAIAAGRPVLRYRSDLLLDVDEVYEDGIPTCGDADLREALLALVRDGRRAGFRESPKPAVPPLFVPLDRERLEEVFGAAS